MLHVLRSVMVSGVLVALASACGSSDSEKQAAPPPVTPQEGSDIYALQAGSYYITELRDLNDGCGKKPLESSEPITQVPFILSNDGQGNITMDFCSFNGRSLTGQVRGNQGTLAVVHQNREQGAAKFDQACRMELVATRDNRFDMKYSESQSNRNEALRNATINVNECTTSFSATMQRR